MGNIIHTSNNYDHNVYVTGAGKTRRIESAEGQPTEKKSEINATDKVSLSKASKDMQLAKESVQAAPDIRHETIDPIKRKIAEGRYEVRAEDVAERMIGTHIREWI